MTRQDFEETLKGVKPGEYVDFPYDFFTVFPPDAANGHARIMADAYAREHGFEIENRESEEVVRFRKIA